MIVQKPLEGFEDKLVHTYSDIGMCILQVETGIIYEAADDVIPCRYTYTETDIPLPEPEPDPEPDENQGE